MVRAAEGVSQIEDQGEAELLLTVFDGKKRKVKLTAVGLKFGIHMENNYTMWDVGPVRQMKHKTLEHRYECLILGYFRDSLKKHKGY